VALRGKEPPGSKRTEKEQTVFCLNGQLVSANDAQNLAFLVGVGNVGGLITCNKTFTYLRWTLKRTPLDSTDLNLSGIFMEEMEAAF
jgi:hypothetical protein